MVELRTTFLNMKINIDGEDFLLNVEKAKKAGFLTSPGKIKDGQPIKIGDVFEVDGTNYLLSLLSRDRIALISLSDGNRWTNPVAIIDKPGWTITEEEFLSALVNAKADEVIFKGNILYAKILFDAQE